MKEEWLQVPVVDLVPTTRGRDRASQGPHQDPQQGQRLDRDDDTAAGHPNSVSRRTIRLKAFSASAASATAAAPARSHPRGNSATSPPTITTATAGSSSRNDRPCRISAPDFQI